MKQLTEKELADRVCKRLGNHFHIEREVHGYHKINKEKYRIDAVISPIDKSMWANKDVCFGIEFKSKEVIKSARGGVNMILQAANYTNVSFGEYGRMPILLCPPVSFESQQVDRKYADHTAFFFKRMLGYMGLGELINDRGYDKKDNLTIVFHQSHRIWSESQGVIEGDRWKFNKMVSL